MNNITELSERICNCVSGWIWWRRMARRCRR